MTLSSVPKSAWQAGAVVALLSLLAMCTLKCVPPAPKPQTAVSIYGETVRLLERTVVQESGHEPAFRVGMPVAPGAADEEIDADADKMFEAFVGAQATEFGFRRVLIRPDDGSQADGGWFGFTVSFHVEIGPGPADEADSDGGETKSGGAIAYDKTPDGLWSRGGVQPPAPQHLEEYALASGARFALTSAYENYPAGTFVYDCLTCSGKDAVHHMAGNLLALMRGAALDRAKRNGLKSFSVVVFAGARRTQWEFPPSVHFNLTRRADGRWAEPAFSPAQIERRMAQYLRQARDRGAKWRSALK